jgi:hypothetical protein
MRYGLFLLFCLFLVLSVGPVYAGPSPSDGPVYPRPSPPDDPNTAGAPSQQAVLQTALFALGEVDLSTLGVSDIDLLTVGPQLDPLSSSNDGMLIVDDDGLDCPNFQYMTIQAAVDAAVPGDKIKVCAGIYMEQVTIPAGKDNLTLFSAPDLQAVIKAPLVMIEPKAIVRVNGAQNVTIRHFTITGPGVGICASIRYGVRVDNGGSALITDNHITEIHDTPFGGCQTGYGVNVGRLADGTTGTATVVHNLIDKYQKGGVFVDNVGSSAEVAYNEVDGAGPTPIIAQNGIAVGRGAQGVIHHNKVSQNVYTGGGNVATGIIPFRNPVARVHHNDVFLNDVGIAPFIVAAGTAEVSYNNSRNNLSDGIHAYSTSGNLIAYNKAFQNGMFDCADDTIPTRNTWLKDLGRTENQPGLCKQAGPM